MSESITNGLYADPELAQFYEANDRNRLDYDVIFKLAQGAKTILDLGCGTGVLSARLAKNAYVTAVDPAGAMLDIGRERYGDVNLDWVEGDARGIRLGRKFDFILLSGHAFQVFLTKEDQRAVFETIATHLSDKGKFIFDSRNPYFPNSKERTKSETLHKFHHSKLGEVEAWNESNYDERSGVLTYSNSYQVQGSSKFKSAQEQIKYTPKSELLTLINEVGLNAIQCFGDWDRIPFHKTSREIILIGMLQTCERK